MGAFTDLLAKIDERGARLDQVDQAIAEIRRQCLERKPKRSVRQLRLPLTSPGKHRKAAA